MKRLVGPPAGSDIGPSLASSSIVTLDSGSLDITACNDSNRADIFVIGHAAEPDGEQQIAIATRLDNLGKGAAGAAIQCMHLAIA